MANMIMNTVYNQYLTTYAPKKSDTRYDTHKRSELRSIYNSMVKVNRDAPLYIMDNTSDMRAYVVGLKEEARKLHNTIAAVSGDTENIDFHSKIAFSSDENVLSARYIGAAVPGLSGHTENSNADSPNQGTVIAKNGENVSYGIHVKSLASPQVNLGKFLPGDTREIAYGEYSFDVSVEDLGYEFQFSIQPDDTNLDIQNRISRLINNSGIGLKSSVEPDHEGNYALRIESLKTGTGTDPSVKPFSIKDNSTVRLGGSVDYLGLDYTAQEAENAVYTVNGKEMSSTTNTFILDKTYEIQLHNISPNEGQEITVGMKPDTEALQENIRHLLGGYNQFMKGIESYQKSQQKSSHLKREFESLSGYYEESLKKIGIDENEDGQFVLNEDRLNASVAMEESDEPLSALKNFSTSMIRKTDQISLNPIRYVNKTIVAYKNPANIFTHPYVSSSYAGMMFNSYC